ncbi:MAG TPA: hypothetical protein VLM89_03090, partial [Phycisphaerae bacterium]|nr:hypothetical protein [Phycisphaerae bacterium]
MNDTQYFTTTRIRVYIRRTGNSGVLFMSIRSAGGGTVIEEVNTPITSVATGGYIWHEYSLSGLPQFTPGTYYSFMLRSNTASGIACLGRNEYPSNFLSDNMWYFNTDNGGSSFYPTYQRDARFMLYGRFKLNRPQFNPDVTRTWLKSFDIRLTASDGGRTIELRSGTPCPNLPEITGRF